MAAAPSSNRKHLMYKLYGQRGAGSLAPHIVLEELGVPYEFQHIEKDFMKSAEYLRINPLGVVPTLVLPNGKPIVESAAMIMHLTNAHASALAPQPGTPAHAEYLQWMVFISANVYETLLRTAYSDRYTAGGAAEAAKVKEKSEADMTRQFGIIERALDPFLHGKEPGAADIYLHMFTTWRTPRNALARYPKIAALGKAIGSRPAVRKVMAVNAD